MAAANPVIQNYLTSGICGRPNTSNKVRIPPTSMNSDKNLWLQRKKKMKPYQYTGVLKKDCPTYDNSQENYHSETFSVRFLDSAKGVFLKISKIFRIFLNGYFCNYKNLADKNMFKVRHIQITVKHLRWSFL